MTKQNVAVREAVTMAVPPAAAAAGSTASMFPYPPPRAATRGYMRKRLLKQLDIGAGLNGGRVSAWVESMRASSPTHDDARSPRTLEHPSALSTFREIAKLFEEKQIVVFLDYDGTLSPIVEDPECAFMDDAMRDTLRDVAKYFPTAIVSGRCRDKVYSFVQLPELYYAGSHGMDIKGPDIIGGPKCTAVQAAKSVLHQPAGDFLPMIDQVYKILSKKMKSIPGARVENNKFCLSVHFRCVDEKRWRGLAEQVKAVLRDHPELRLTHGRKVLEIRPTVKWDKGKALEFLLESLGFDGCKDVLPVYIGDDRTDEDAFRALRERGQGFGILVSKIPRDTHASYSLQEPSEVKEFLKRLVDWKQREGDPRGSFR